MENTFKYIKKTRELFAQLVSELTEEQLNEIPEGFKNNIAWNFGHIIISTPGLCYLRSGVQPDLEIPYLMKYKNGSKPETFIVKEELNILKEYGIKSIEKLEQDIKEKKFTNITPFSTLTFGYPMSTIEEIVACSQSHDSIHFGIALAMKKMVVNN